MTLNEIKNLDVLKDALVLSGEESLYKVVESVSVLEVYEKNLFIRHGELLITSLSGIKDDVEKQINTISMLHDIGAAGIVLCHVGYVINKINPRLISHSRKLKFPIIVPDPSVTFINILSPCVERLLFYKNKHLEEIIDVLNSFDNISSTNHTIFDILSSLEQIINKPVYYIDPDHNFFSNYALFEDLNLHYKRLQGKLVRNKICYCCDGKEKNYYFQPIISAGKYYGCLVAETNNFSARNLYWTALKKASTNIIFDNIHAVRQRDYTSRITNDLLLEILTNDNINPEIIKIRANNMNVKINLPAYVAMVNFGDFGQNISKRNVPATSVKKEQMVETIYESFKDLKPFIIPYENKFLLVVSTNSYSQNDIKKICQLMINNIKLSWKLEPSIIIGTKCINITELNYSYNKILKTENISKLLLNKSMVIFYEDMKNLVEINDSLSKQTIQQISNLISPLVDYDILNKASLCVTLRELIQNDYKLLETSIHLFIHKNTVLQRKNKITEILGFNPFIYPHRSLIELAVLFGNFKV